MHVSDSHSTLSTHTLVATSDWVQEGLQGGAGPVQPSSRHDQLQPCQKGSGPRQWPGIPHKAAWVHRHAWWYQGPAGQEGLFPAKRGERREEGMSRGLLFKFRNVAWVWIFPFLLLHRTSTVQTWTGWKEWAGRLKDVWTSPRPRKLESCLAMSVQWCVCV